MIMKCQPVLPAAAVNTSICSSSVSGRGSCLEVNASGPSGSEAPKENRRARLPNSASNNGNSSTSCRPRGCASVSMFSPCSLSPAIHLATAKDQPLRVRETRLPVASESWARNPTRASWSARSPLQHLYSIAGVHLKVKDRISTRRPDPPITDDERRDQSAGERESGRDQHNGAEPGDEGLVYGALDVPRRPCIHVLRCFRGPEMDLLPLHFAANLA